MNTRHLNIVAVLAGGLALIAPARGLAQPEAAPASAEPADEPAESDAEATTESNPASKTEAAIEKSAGEGHVAEPPDVEGNPGYLPGYRRHLDTGLSPFAPRAGSSPGGLTSSYGVPTPEPPGGWTFSWSGFMTASLQTTINSTQRPNAADGQAEIVFHTPPQTVDEFWNFTSTNTVPGNWVNMNFQYGSENVTATMQINTWNPTTPTSYYQMGSQNFLNNMFLTFRAQPIEGIRLRWNVGYFFNMYGQLGQWGNGLYFNTVAGGPQGVGETTTAEYDLSDSTTLVLEHGIMGNRHGKAPDDVVPTPIMGYMNPIWPAAWIHHAHAGLVFAGDTRYMLQFHYLHNFAQDERIERVGDNRFSREIDETDVRDGSIRVYAFDARATNGVWGMLGIGASIIDAKNAFPLRGLITYAGDGEQLTQRFLGRDSRGTGKLYVAAVNYSMSLGTILSHPTRFTEGPDVLIQTGAHLIMADSPVEEFDGRVRHKYGVDAMYLMTKHFGAGARFDRVVPHANDPEETFHVLAPMLQFKTDWNSRENLVLKYAKWFYGPNTRRDDGRHNQLLDDQLIALNFNMWW